MTRSRSQKRHCSSRKSPDENDHSHTGQGEEIATPPAQHMIPRRGRPINFTKMNTSNTGHGYGRQNHSLNFKKNQIQRKRIKRKKKRRRRRRKRRRMIGRRKTKRRRRYLQLLTSKKIPMCILGRLHLIIPKKE